jgi:nucleotide-binding universal stress UspA family protein
MKFPFKKILAPTDFSEPSYRALEWARELAEKFSSELFLVHVVAPMPAVTPVAVPTTFDVPLYQKGLRESAEKSLDELREKRLPEGVNVRTEVRIGQAAHEIVKMAEENQADLIVIATHGATGLEHILFGSVAEKVVRTADCPVLTVPGIEKKK